MSTRIEWGQIPDSIEIEPPGTIADSHGTENDAPAIQLAEYGNLIVLEGSIEDFRSFAENLLLACDKFDVEHDDGGEPDAQ